MINILVLFSVTDNELAALDVLSKLKMEIPKIYVDLRKVFYKINNKNLLEIIQKFVYNWNAVRSIKNINCVLQGSLLGSILFLSFPGAL